MHLHTPPTLPHLQVGLAYMCMQLHFTSSAPSLGSAAPHTPHLQYCLHVLLLYLVPVRGKYGWGHSACTQQHLTNSAQGSTMCGYHRVLLAPQFLWMGQFHVHAQQSRLWVPQNCFLVLHSLWGRGRESSSVHSPKVQEAAPCCTC